jgi:hypothetical protein
VFQQVFSFPVVDARNFEQFFGWRVALECVGWRLILRIVV